MHRPKTSLASIASGAIASILPLAFVLVAACADDPDALLGRVRPDPSENGGALAEALRCSEKPNARSYASFDGARLEASRVDENSGANRARFKPFAVLAGEYKRVLGVVQ